MAAGVRSSLPGLPDAFSNIDAQNYAERHGDGMMKFSVIGALTLCMLAIAANATYNSVVTGSVEFVQQMAVDTGYGFVPETFTFQLINQPNINCGTFQYFSVSSVIVPDAQARKNILAMLLQGKVTGAQVQVAYDSAGGFCDQRMAGVYYVVLR